MTVGSTIGTILQDLFTVASGAKVVSGVVLLKVWQWIKAKYITVETDIKKVI